MAHRARTSFAGTAVLLGLLAVVTDPAQSPLLVGVALTLSMLLVSMIRLLLPAVCTGATVGPRRACAPGVILPSTHPDAAGHPRPRAPGAMAVAPA